MRFSEKRSPFFSYFATVVFFYLVVVRNIATAVNTLQLLEIRHVARDLVANKTFTVKSLSFQFSP